MLTSFEIRKFRKFDHLVIDRLGKVNLIVGKNNSGKTSLMEAIQIYSEGASLSSLRGLMLKKDEINVVENEDDNLSYSFLNIFSIFKDRIFSTDYAESIQMGPLNNSEKIYIRLAIFKKKEADNDELNLEPVDGVPVGEDPSEHTVGIQIRKGIFEELYLIEDFFYTGFNTKNQPSKRRIKQASPNNIFVSTSIIDQSEISKQWDLVSLRDSEQRVIDLLQCIAPIERVSFVNRPIIGMNGKINSGRIVMVRLAGESTPVPLKSLGDGVVRVFQIALAIESARERLEARKDTSISLFEDYRQSYNDETLVFIDELENGIHYTALESVWTFIFQLAERENIQIFATSHSWDCIESFQKIASRSYSSEGVLIKLVDNVNSVRAVTFSESELQIAARNQIEVR